MAERQPAPIGRLIAAFRRLPGIGEKTATRLSYFLLAAPDTVAEELGNALLRLRKDVVLCDECFNLTEVSPCEVCRDPERSAAQLCVVEEPADLASIETAGVFRGRYHVLGGTLAPLDGVGPEGLRVEPLLERVKRGEVVEVILATNPNPEGELQVPVLVNTSQIEAGIFEKRPASILEPRFVMFELLLPTDFREGWNAHILNQLLGFFHPRFVYD